MKFTVFYLFIYLWLCWVFVSMRGLSLAVASGDHSSSQRAGLSPSRPLLLWSTGSRRAGSATVAHGPSCSAACGIFPDQGSNPCPLHWQADSQPLRHQGSPLNFYLRTTATPQCEGIGYYLVSKGSFVVGSAIEWCVVIGGLGMASLGHTAVSWGSASTLVNMSDLSAHSWPFYITIHLCCGSSSLVIYSNCVNSVVFRGLE